MKHKSDTKQVFIPYKALVGKDFQLPLKTLYSYNGGEYTTLHNYLSIDGISDLIIPPHTPQHNGNSECRHRHIVETLLSLLTHASIPLKYWTDATSTAAYLINRLSTSNVNNVSPYYKLFDYYPNYLTL